MSGKVERFEDLDCWKEGRVLVNQIYKVTSPSPFSRDFGLRDQIQRAALSVMSNIAEGFGSASRLELIRFLRYSHRSCSEVESQLYVALDLKYITPERFNDIYNQCIKCSNFIKAFIKYLKEKKINLDTPTHRHIDTKKLESI